MHALFAASDPREVLPDFFARKTHDRCQQTDQRFADAPDRGLCAATGLRLRRRNVEAVLENVEVKGAQVHDAEMVHPVIDLVEGELVVPVADVGGEGASLAQHVLVEFFHLLEGNRVFYRIEIVEIAHNVAKRVANLLVVLADALHQRFGTDHIFAEVYGSSPEAHDLSAEATGDVDRIDVVAA